ncbi:hypothetical protein FOA52_001519 [Chlamydomonas sp. UWO 241]|nr:hypothetical protein FOA52_001519 [Chlamydomonas sp. UWO 241]
MASTHGSAAASSLRPQNVGILAMDVYLPRCKVMQAELEARDGCAGKYTVGLGQVSLSFCTSREDVVSMALTAVERLLRKAGIKEGDVGRLEVGTESALDRSKSTKSCISSLFAAACNTSLEGADVLHGCYGATAALLNAAAWVESSAWCGRLAVVVATDVAVYEPDSPARPTGGCGAVAMLVGPDAPLALDPAWRSVYSNHTHDFSKPVGGASSPHPSVDGPATLTNILRAGDACYARLARSLQQRRCLVGGAAGADGSAGAAGAGAGPPPSPLQLCDHFVSHAPFNKMVRKLVARLHLTDALRARRWHAGAAAAATGAKRARRWYAGAAPAAGDAAAAAAAAGLGAGGAAAAAAAAGAPHTGRALQALSAGAPTAAGPPLDALARLLDPDAELDLDALPGTLHTDRALQAQLLSLSAGVYGEKAADAADVQRQIGNTYTGSLWMGVAGLVEAHGASLTGRRLLLFSYGAGAMASMLGLVGRAPSLPHRQQSHARPGVDHPVPYTLERMAASMSVRHALAEQRVCAPAEYDAASDAVVEGYRRAEGLAMQSQLVDADASASGAVVSAALQAMRAAAASGDVVGMEGLLLNTNAAQAKSLLTAVDAKGVSALMHAAMQGHAGAIRVLLDHPAADAANMMMAVDDDGKTALIHAAWSGFAEAMRVLLDHPSADAAAMMVHATSTGATALTVAAYDGHVGAMRLLLDHPSADAAAMMRHAKLDGSTALTLAAQKSRVDVMRLLLGHPSADAADMMLHATSDGATALTMAAWRGRLDAMRMLLDHPSADAAAMMAVQSADGTSALTAAAGFAAGNLVPDGSDPMRSCTPLLLLLRREAAQSQPCDAQQAHVSRAMEALRRGPRLSELFQDDQPDGVRDECVRLLLEQGAPYTNSPCESRIIRELCQLARVPQLINEAVVGMAIVQGQRKPRDTA